MRAVRPWALTALVLAGAAGPLSGQSIVLKVGDGNQTSVAPDGMIAVPVVVDLSQAGGRNVASVQVTLSWNASALTYVSAGGTTFGSPTVNDTQASNGQLVLSTFGTSGTTSSFTLSEVTFRAASQEQTVTLSLGSPVIADETGTSLVSLTTTQSLSLCVGVTGLWGDVNDDGQVNIIDAQQLARFAVGLSVSNSQAVQDRGDVNEDGSVNIIDAQQVARFAVGLPTSGRAGESLPGCAAPGFDEIRVSPTSVEMGINQSTTLTAAAYQSGSAVSWPGGDATWTVANTSLARVTSSSGQTATIEALAAGTTTVTASLSGVTSTAVTIEVKNVGAASSVGTLGGTVTNVTPTAATLGLNVVVLDPNGAKVSVPASSYSITDLGFNGGTLGFNVQGTGTGTSPYSGPFSAALVIDQSGSIDNSGNDPNGARLTASKQFARGMQSGDETALYTFSYRSSIVRRADFTGSASVIETAVDAIGTPTGQTALYSAGVEACNYVGDQAKNSNKFVVLLTDGGDNDSNVSLSGLVDACTTRGVKVFTVGFGGANSANLTQIAVETGGMAFVQGDVSLLLSAFQGAPALMRGSTVPDKVTLTITATGVSLSGGGTIDHTITVALGGGKTASAPFRVSWSGSSTGNTISYGTTESGTISSGGTQQWTFDASSGDGLMVLSVPATSSYDPTTTVSPIGGVTLGGDLNTFADGGEWVVGLVSQAGTKNIGVAGASGTSGAYSLVLNRCTVTETSVGSTVTSSLDTADCWIREASTPFYGEYVRFAGTQGATVTIDLESSFDNFLIFFDPSGLLIATNDDGGTGNNARISMTLPSSGTYTIYPSSVSPAVVGDFTLSVSAGSSQRRVAPAFEVGSEDKALPRTWATLRPMRRR